MTFSHLYSIRAYTIRDTQIFIGLLDHVVCPQLASLDLHAESRKESDSDLAAVTRYIAQKIPLWLMDVLIIDIHYKCCLRAYPSDVLETAGCRKQISRSAWNPPSRPSLCVHLPWCYDPSGALNLTLIRGLSLTSVSNLQLSRLIFDHSSDQFLPLLSALPYISVLTVHGEYCPVSLFEELTFCSDDAKPGPTASVLPSLHTVKLDSVHFGRRCNRGVGKSYEHFHNMLRVRREIGAGIARVEIRNCVDFTQKEYDGLCQTGMGVSWDVRVATEGS